MIHMIDQSIREALQKPNVVGTAMGQKYVNGLPTDQQAIIVFVQKKVKPDELSIQSALPTSIDGVPIDVLEVGDIVKQDLKTKVRPIKPGYSVAHPRVTAGTIGGIFKDRDGDVVILSNNHVLANENAATIGDVIYQPSQMDAPGSTFTGWEGDPKGWPCIGTLKAFKQLGDNNTHDSAICKIHELIITKGLIDTSYPMINASLKGFAEVNVGTPVQKCGRTTGYTTGKVLATHGEFTIGYDEGPKRFTDCVVMSAMSQGGDSGSIIMDHQANAVALLFAGSDKVTLAHPIRTVVDHYGLSIFDQVSGIVSNDRRWVAYDGPNDECTIDPLLGVYGINAHANNYAYAETTGTKFNEFYAEIYTGQDMGATWGPGMAVVWPNGTLKINLRREGTFGASYQGTEYLPCGRVRPDTWYPMKISVNDKVVGQVKDGETWVSVIQLPLNVITPIPTAFRIGKMDLNGNASSYHEAGSKRSCAFRNYRIS